MEKKIEKTILALFLIIVMLSGLLYSKSYRYVDEMIDSVVVDVKAANGKERDKDARNGGSYRRRRESSARHVRRDGCS